MIVAEWARVRTYALQLGWRADTEDEVRAQLPPLPQRVRMQALVSLHATVQLKLGHATESQKTKAREVNDLQEQTDAVTIAALPAGLSAALAQSLRLGDTQATARVLRQAVDKSMQAESRAYRAARLGAREFSAEAGLASLLLPTDKVARQHVADEQTDAADERSAAKGISEFEEQIEQLNLEISQFKAANRTVEHNDLLAARDNRDRLWRTLVAAPESLASQASAFEDRVQDADQLADLRHDTAREASALQEKRHRLAALSLRLQHAQDHLQAVQRSRAARAQAWSAMAAAAGVPELRAEDLADWRKLRTAALDATAATAEARQAVDAYQGTCLDVVRALASALSEPTGLAATTDIDPLQERAQGVLQAVEHANVLRSSLATQLDAARRALVPLEEALKTAKSSASEWQADWDRALHDAGLVITSSIDEVTGTLATFNQIDSALTSIQTTRNDRVAGPKAELETLGDLAQSLAERVAPALAGRKAAEIAVSLVEQLDNTKRAAAELSRLRAQQQQSQQRLDDATTRHDAATVMLQPMLLRAGAPHLEALTLAIDRSDEQRRLAAERARAEQALLAAGDGMTLGELRAEAEPVDPATLMADLEEISLQEGEIIDTVSRLAVDRERAQRALDLIGGSAAAAIAEARRQEALSRMTDAVERYVTLSTSARLLRWAIERFRETQQGPMLAGASRYFEQLTGGSFERLVVDFEHEPPTLEGRRADGSLVGVAGMSDGTRDQLFLALRLAALDMHLEAGHAMPFIADDLFVNFDDDRSLAGFSALGALSRRTQVIYLTHHRHLADLARQALGPAVRVIDL